MPEQALASLSPQRPRPAAASVLAIGLMSGTSQDGVDVALIDTDGERIAQFGATACRPYTKDERTLLRRATAAAVNMTERSARPDTIAEAEALVNEAHIEAVQSFLASNSLPPDSVGAIGFHGQTLLHLYPDLGIGARRTVSRFHRADFARLVPWALPLTRPWGSWRRWAAPSAGSCRCGGSPRLG